MYYEAIRNINGHFSVVKVTYVHNDYDDVLLLPELYNSYVEAEGIALQYNSDLSILNNLFSATALTQALH